MRVEDFVEIWSLICNELLQLGDLSDLLECKDFILLITVYCQAGRVVSSVLKPGEAIDKSI